MPSREPTSCFAHIAFQLWLVASRLDCLALGAKLPLQQGWVDVVEGYVRVYTADFQQVGFALPMWLSNCC